ncbi:unnamed protein product [Schistosoma haematobium]|nr:unnamed protein product [Schistosoma haematobium]
MWLQENVHCTNYLRFPHISLTIKLSEVNALVNNHYHYLPSFKVQITSKFNLNILKDEDQALTTSHYK